MCEITKTDRIEMIKAGYDERFINDLYRLMNADYFLG